MAVARGRPAPLVIDLHGYGQSAAQQEDYAGLAAPARAAGVVVATPRGVQARWNFPRRPAVGPDDVAFLRDLINDVATATCLDRGRVVLAGFSDGADMANTAGCAFGRGVAAVFAVAPSVTVADCPVGPATLIEVHGTADPIVPYGGGGGDRPAPFEGTEALSVDVRLGSWARQRRCGRTTARPVSPHVRGTRWRCPDGRILALYAVNGGGHTWPGAAPWPSLGPTTTERSATAAVIALALDPHALPW